MPHPSLPLRLPAALLVCHPLQVHVARPGLPADPPVLQLGKMALKEADLVLAVDARRVGILTHNTKVIVHLALVDGGLGLRDELSAAHVLAVPERGAVEG